MVLKPFQNGFNVSRGSIFSWFSPSTCHSKPGSKNDKMREETRRRILQALEKHERTRLSGFFGFKYTETKRFPYILIQEDIVESIYDIIIQDGYHLPDAIRYNTPGKDFIPSSYNNTKFIFQEHTFLLS